MDKFQGDVIKQCMTLFEERQKFPGVEMALSLLHFRFWQASLMCILQ